MRTLLGSRVGTLSALCLATALAGTVRASPSGTSSVEVAVGGSNAPRQIPRQTGTNTTVLAPGALKAADAPGSTAHTTKPGETDDRTNRSLPTSPQAADDSMPHSRRDMTGLFFDGVVAVFAVLSLVFSVLVAAFAVKGWSAYKELKRQLHSEVKSELTTKLTTELVQVAHAELERQVHAEIQEELGQSLVVAKQQLRDELQKMAKEPEWQEAFAKEMKIRVEGLLRPASKEVTSDEFDGPETTA